MSQRESVPDQSDWRECPGCGGRGVIVSLGSVLACRRCHGAGRIDLVREEAERRERDKRLQQRVTDELARLDALIEAASDEERQS